MSGEGVSLAEHVELTLAPLVEGEKGGEQASNTRTIATCANARAISRPAKRKFTRTPKRKRSKNKM